MELLKKYWAAIAAGVVGFVGLLLWLLSGKKSQIDGLNAQIAEAKTEKDADVLESQINTLKADENNLDKHNQELDKSLQNLQDKRSQIVADQKKLTDPQQVADYWNHQ